MRSCRTVLFHALLSLSALPLIVAVTAEAAPNPDVRSHAFYVLDPSESSVLAARHEDEPMPIASITKLMTAIVVLEAGQPLEEVLEITAEDVRGTRGGRSRLAQGSKLTRGDMLHLALMSSENRSAHAVCRSYPDGLSACVEAMNARAAALGMTATKFVEPTGLSSDNVASPEDLAKLVVAASRNPVIREYSTDPEQTVAVNGQPFEYRNTNLLVKKPEWQVSLQKTGYISAAGRCLVMEAVIDSREVVIVLLNSWGTLTRFADAKRIRNWLEAQTRLAGT